MLEDLPAVDMATKRAFSFAPRPRNKSRQLNKDEFLDLLEKAKNTSPVEKQDTFVAITELFGSASEKKNENSSDNWEQRDEFSGVLPPRKKRKS